MLERVEQTWEKPMGCGVKCSALRSWLSLSSWVFPVCYLSSGAQCSSLKGEKGTLEMDRRGDPKCSQSKALSGSVILYPLGRLCVGNLCPYFLMMESDIHPSLPCYLCSSCCIQRDWDKEECHLSHSLEQPYHMYDWTHLCIQVCEHICKYITHTHLCNSLQGFSFPLSWYNPHPP